MEKGRTCVISWPGSAEGDNEYDSFPDDENSSDEFERFGLNSEETHI